MQTTQSLKQTVLKNYLTYLIPTIIGMVTYSLYCLADVLFVSIGVGSKGLAALNISLPIFPVYSCIALLIGVGASITIGVLKGEGKTHLADKVLTMALLTILVVGSLLTIISCLFTSEIAVLLGADATILGDAVAYLKPVAISVLFYMLCGTLTVIVRGDGNPSLVMAAGVIGNVLNIGLDYIFIIPLDMGTFGAGLATAIGFSTSMFILLFHFILKKNTVHFVRHFFDKVLYIRLLSNGIGAAILELSSGITIFLINLALMKVSGATAVAIYSVISNIAFIAKGLFGGMAQASQPIISLNYGLRDFRIVKLAHRYAMLVAGISGAIAFTLLALFAKPIIASLVTNELAVITQGTNAIRLYFCGFAFTGFNTVLMYYFQSIERSFYSTLMACIRGIGLLFVLLLILPNFLGEAGIWLALPLTELIAFAIFMSIRLLYVDKQLAKYSI